MGNDKFSLIVPRATTKAAKAASGTKGGSAAVLKKGAPSKVTSNLSAFQNALVSASPSPSPISTSPEPARQMGPRPAVKSAVFRQPPKPPTPQTPPRRGMPLPPKNAAPSQPLHDAILELPAPAAMVVHGGSNDQGDGSDGYISVDGNGSSGSAGSADSAAGGGDAGKRPSAPRQSTRPSNGGGGDVANNGNGNNNTTNVMNTTDSAEINGITTPTNTPPGARTTNNGHL